MKEEKAILKDNIKNFRLLNEWVNRNEVVDAIKNADIVYIYYAGDETVNRGYRTIEPYVLGTSKAGNLVLRAYQQAGASDSKVNADRPNDMLPGWRLFRLDGITSFMKTSRKFNPKKPRPDYNPDDKGMTSIIAAVNPATDKGFELKGGSSLDEPDVNQQKISAFDPQSKGFKDFYDASQKQNTITKKTVADLYQLVRNYYKKDPSKYIVVNKNGRYWVDKVSNARNYNENDVYGNLNNLYREYTNAQRGQRITNQFIDDKRREFIKTLEKEQQ